MYNYLLYYSSKDIIQILLFIPKMSFVVKETPSWYAVFCSPVSVVSTDLGLHLSFCLTPMWTFGECSL